MVTLSQNNKIQEESVLGSLGLLEESDALVREYFAEFLDHIIVVRGNKDVPEACLGDDLLELRDDGVLAGKTELPAQLAPLVGVSQALGGAEEVGQAASLRVITGLAPVQAIPRLHQHC